MMAFAMPIIREQLAKLLAWAGEDKNVELYAEVLLYELPAIVHNYVNAEQALSALKREDWFVQVTALEPRLVPHREWMDDMRKELIAIIEDQLREDKKLKRSTTPGQIVDPLNGDAGE